MRREPDKDLIAQYGPNGIVRRDPFLLDPPEPDPDPGCPTCYRTAEECPGHDDDPEALDILAALVNALRSLPGLHPVPISIVREINRCEDYLRKHNPDRLPGGRF